MIAPTITVHDYTMTQGQAFNNSDLGVKVTEGAKVTYTGNVDTNKPGTYSVTITAINSYRANLLSNNKHMGFLGRSKCSNGCWK